MPIHQTYKDNTDNIQYANYNFKISWGDGSYDEVNCTGSNTTLWNTDSTSMYYGYPCDFPTASVKNSITKIKRYTTYI